MSTRYTPLVGVFVLTTLVAACGSGHSDAGAFQPSGRQNAVSDSAKSSAAPAPSTMTTQQVDQAVLERYREYQRVYKMAYEKNDPSELSTVAMDPLLSAITKDVEATAAKGEIWRFTNVPNPKIQGRTKDNRTVIVLDCLRTLGAYRYSAKSGKRLGSYGGNTILYQAVMQFTNGTWKISNAKQGQKC